MNKGKGRGVEEFLEGSEEGNEFGKQFLSLKRKT